MPRGRPRKNQRQQELPKNPLPITDTVTINSSENDKVMTKYRLVNNTEYDLSGVYYVGLSKKYWDMFNIGTRDIAKIYTDLQEAIKDKEMLKRRFGYEYFEVETVQEIIKN